MKTGLVSVTFRERTPQELVKLVAEAGLDGIEWGGDVHVPHGDVATAQSVRKLTIDAGLAVASYGSYYRAVESEQDGLQFASVLESAVELAAPCIRVWAGKQGSAQADVAYRAAVVEDLRRIGTLSESAGLGLTIEYHGKTLTDTDESAQLLINEVAHPNVRLYWQTPIGQPADACRAGLQAIIPHLSNLHVFHWVVSDGKREQRALAEGETAWMEYLRIATADDIERWALLEFVRGGTPEQFLEDAAALRRWVAAV